jgi:membrane protein required for colicin V production
MLIDIIAFGLIILALFKGLRNGLVVALFSLVAFVIGLAAALKLSAAVAEYLGENTSISGKWLPVLAFAIVFLGVMLLVRLGAKLIEGALRLVMLGWLNRIGGVLFYGLLYLFVYSVLLFYAYQLELIKPQTVSTSMTFGYIYPVAPEVMRGMGNVLPFLRDTFSDLENFFDNIAQKR